MLLVAVSETHCELDVSEADVAVHCEQDEAEDGARCEVDAETEDAARCNHDIQDIVNNMDDIPEDAGLAEDEGDDSIDSIASLDGGGIEGSHCSIARR